jgi:hypothetical protein
VNGDGSADVVFQNPNNQFFVSLSTGTGFTTPSSWIHYAGSFVAGQVQYADFNGDGRADLSFQGANNQFWVSPSTGAGFGWVTL